MLVQFPAKALFTFLLLCGLEVKSQISSDCSNRPQLTVLPEACCKIPDFFDDADLMKCKNARGTENLFRQKRFATSRMELGTCYLDCVFQTTSVISPNGQVLDTNRLLRILVSETPTELDSINVITSAVTQCMVDLNSGTMRARNPTKYNCSTIPSAIMMCIHRRFFLSCPQGRFANNQQCVQLRDYLNRCPVTI